MKFSDIPGNDALKQHLRQVAVDGKVPHAMILQGAEGNGALGLAIAFAQYLLCDGAKAEEACGVCGHCRKSSKLVHPDLHFSYPTIGTNALSSQFAEKWREAIQRMPFMNVFQWLQWIGAENKQGNINKDECQAILHKFGMKAYECPYKILILWMPEYLSKEGNRLLKLIEEPPDNAFFIMVAQDTEQILNTILSRCRIYKTQMLTDVQVQQKLVQSFDIDPIKANSIALLSDGNLSKAVEFMNAQTTLNYSSFFKWLLSFFSSDYHIKKNNFADLITHAEEVATLSREELKQFFLFGNHFFRELLLRKLHVPMPTRLLSNEIEVLENLIKVIPLKHIESIVSLFDEMIQNIERNANAKIAMTGISVKLHKILKNTE